MKNFMAVVFSIILFTQCNKSKNGLIEQAPVSTQCAKTPADDPIIAHGAQIFIVQGCDNCHNEDTAHTPKANNIANKQVYTYATTNPYQGPSLLGIAHTAPYMHNEQFATLAALIQSHDGHDINPALPAVAHTLSPTDQQHLLAYMMQLSASPHMTEAHPSGHKK